MYKPDIQLVASDLDDTLLRDDLTISDFSEGVLRNARAAGARVILTSGRMIPAMMRYVEQLRLEEPIIASNGAQIYDPMRREMLREITFSAELARMVCREAEARNQYVQVYYGDRFYYPYDCEYARRYMASTSMQGECVNQPLSQFIDRPTVKLLIFGDERLLPDLQKEMSSLFEGQLNAYISKAFYLEFTHPQADKANALSWLAERLGIAPGAAVCFGDSQNDLPMLKWAGSGVCVANARPEIRAQAKHVTLSNNEDGVAAFVETLLKENRLGICKR